MVKQAERKRAKLLVRLRGRRTARDWKETQKNEAETLNTGTLSGITKKWVKDLRKLQQNNSSECLGEIKTINSRMTSLKLNCP